MSETLPKAKTTQAMNAGRDPGVTSREVRGGPGPDPDPGPTRDSVVGVFGADSGAGVGAGLQVRPTGPNGPGDRESDSPVLEGWIFFVSIFMEGFSIAFFFLCKVEFPLSSCFFSNGKVQLYG